MVTSGDSCKGDSCRGCELWFDRGATSGSAKIRQPKRERQLGGLGGVRLVPYLKDEISGLFQAVRISTIFLVMVMAIWKGSHNPTSGTKTNHGYEPLTSWGSHCLATLETLGS